jgi:hypothetical protein
MLNPRYPKRKKETVKLLHSVLQQSHEILVVCSKRHHPAVSRSKFFPGRIDYQPTIPGQMLTVARNKFQKHEVACLAINRSFRSAFAKR